MTIFYILRVQFRYLAETCECTNQVAAIPELCWKKILDQCATSQTTYISFKTNTIANSILLAREDAGLMTIFIF
jgi:hypothetical protein